jgi:hypothetical protein
VQVLVSRKTRKTDDLLLSQVTILSAPLQCGAWTLGQVSISQTLLMARMAQRNNGTNVANPGRLDKPFAQVTMTVWILHTFPHL